MVPILAPTVSLKNKVSPETQLICHVPKPTRQRGLTLFFCAIVAHAQNLVYTLLSLMPSVYQQENLEAMLGLFLEAQGYPLPEHGKTKSASALSRFLNIYN